MFKLLWVSLVADGSSLLGCLFIFIDPSRLLYNPRAFLLEQSSFKYKRRLQLTRAQQTFRGSRICLDELDSYADNTFER